MNPMAKLLIVVGIIFLAAGLLWHFGGRFLPLGRLPGDIVFERDNVRIYIPIVTSILLSILLTLILTLISWWNR